MKNRKRKKRFFAFYSEILRLFENIITTKVVDLFMIYNFSILHFSLRCQLSAEYKIHPYSHPPPIHPESPLFTHLFFLCLLYATLPFAMVSILLTIFFLSKCNLTGLYHLCKISDWIGEFKVECLSNDGFLRYRYSDLGLWVFPQCSVVLDGFLVELKQVSEIFI